MLLREIQENIGGLINKLPYLSINTISHAATTN